MCIDVTTAGRIRSASERARSEVSHAAPPQRPDNSSLPPSRGQTTARMGNGQILRCAISQRPPMGTASPTTRRSRALASASPPPELNHSCSITGPAAAKDASRSALSRPGPSRRRGTKTRPSVQHERDGLQPARLSGVLPLRSLLSQFPPRMVRTRYLDRRRHCVAPRTRFPFRNRITKAPQSEPPKSLFLCGLVSASPCCNCCVW